MLAKTKMWRIVWVATILICVIGAWLRWGGGGQHKQTSTHIKKGKVPSAEKAVDGSRPPSETEDPKLKTPVKKEPKPITLSPEARAHLEEKAFISAVRVVLLWRGTQEANEECQREFVQRLKSIPSSGLTQQHKAAWETLLRSWQSVNETPAETEVGNNASVEEAGEILNALFKAHGERDLTL